MPSLNDIAGARQNRFPPLVKKESLGIPLILTGARFALLPPPDWDFEMPGETPLMKSLLLRRQR